VGAIIMMIEITPSLQIDERELQIDFVRASGPGGQNVNKVATAAQLRFDVGASSLPGDAKARLIRLAGKRITSYATVYGAGSQITGQAKSTQKDKTDESFKRSTIEREEKERGDQEDEARAGLVKSEKWRSEVKRKS
jgi:ribosome-associated protein